MSTVTLKFPLDNGLSQLSLRRPKVRDMLTADKTKGGAAEKEIAMFANLCEVTPDEIEQLDLADYKAVQTVYEAFLS